MLFLFGFPFKPPNTSVPSKKGTPTCLEQVMAKLYSFGPWQRAQELAVRIGAHKAGIWSQDTGKEVGLFFVGILLGA